MERTKERVAVIGSGVSGLCAAWHLQRSGKCDVTVFEAEDRFGGNAHTVNVDGTDWDIGFLVYNNVTYPNLASLFDELDVETVESDMSFSVSLGSGFEWGSENMASLLASRTSILNPSFYRMLWDMQRFNKEMPSFLRKYEDHESIGPSIGEFLQERRYSDVFIERYLAPMISSVWSASLQGSLDVPAKFIFRFFHNHRLAQIWDRPRWRTVKGCSQQYVAKICNDLIARGGKMRSGVRISRVERGSSGVRLASDALEEVQEFDKVVFATHAPTALAILGDGSTGAEQDILSKFNVSTAECILHRDASWMPRSKSAWSAWNFTRKTPEVDAAGAVSTTYYLNKLQKNNLPAEGVPNLFETLNPSVPIPEELIVGKFKMSHPIFLPESLEAQKSLALLQGEKGTYYCGSWVYYGFHEDGARSGFEVASKISGVDVPWKSRLDVLNTVKARDTVAHGDHSAWKLVSNSISRPIVEKFIDASIRIGSLTLVDHMGSRRVFGESREDALSAGRPVSEMFVISPQFYSQVAVFADIGFAEAYMMRAIEFESHEKLLDLLNILILNRDANNLSNSTLSSSRLGTLLNDTAHKILRRNSLSGSKKNIEAHYDLSNDLFATFLGDSWTYSCGLWQEDSFSQDDAQRAKLQRILDLARIDSDCHVLEIGCGWGEFAIFASKTTGCRMTCVTLSEQQLILARNRVKAAGVEDLVEILLCDYRAISGTFDRIVSIEMLEAVGHEYLGSFFESCDKYLNPDGVLVVQVITTPEERYEAYRTSSDFISTYIFPGGCCPSVSALMEAMSKSSSLCVEQMDNFAMDYARTLSDWRLRFNASKERVYELGFDELFIRMW
eukprot:CAMPEP_0113961486 /NCGR_PEP_ID=MMETSP0011_2-20120614/5336_1 /TAXON_ID=101924 /ORGANISM="Rhodosorus marinus" /LENGTH=842 /DNA_ID=CAMNT_0000973133 /DNA_START=338 /DNA_END=2863 /DNA_ORIENTATION=+ /assembly_acc=CAM_ASM_000156